MVKPGVSGKTRGKKVGIWPFYKLYNPGVSWLYQDKTMGNHDKTRGKKVGNWPIIPGKNHGYHGNTMVIPG